MGEFSQIPHTGGMATAQTTLDAMDFHDKCIFCHCCHGTTGETGSLGISQSRQVQKEPSSHYSEAKGYLLNS